MHKEKISRRAFLRVCGSVIVLAFSISLGRRAWAGIVSLKDSMRKRMNAAYRDDKASPRRCSLDNMQATRAFSLFIGRPGEEKARELLHTAWRDRSAAVESLRRKGVYPGKRSGEFRYKKYPFED